MTPKILPPLSIAQQKWTTLYRETLPTLARTQHSKSSTAPWPVQLDHCFARIILDNAIGITQPWHETIAAPATRNMSDAQLEPALQMGRKIADNEVDLWELDAKSLELRNKTPKAGSKRKRASAESGSIGPVKLDRDEKENKKPQTDGESASDVPQKKSRKAEVAEMWSRVSLKQTGKDDSASKEAEAAALAKIRRTISADTSLTPFRKLVLTLLTQVPRGRYTTYQALSDAAMRFSDSPKQASGPEKASKGNGCARAIGGAMRSNPFAPEAPCHRVLASTGKIGGFKGDWGEEGRFVSEKKRLLKEEGVKFDGSGKVVGEPFRGFVKPW